MAEPAITRTVTGSRGRYALPGPGAEAELTYVITAPGQVTADHTFVPDALRGTGAGAALVARLVHDARVEGVKITPLCPFVRAQSLRHPDWADVFVA